MEQSKHIKPRRRVKSSAQRQSLVDTNRVDRISSLPDALVLDILSRLDYNQQVQTSLLSKRWRYLWTFTPCLDFDTVDTGDMDENIAIMDRCLALHQRTKVRNLHLVIIYEDKYRLTIDSWIHFAIQTNVKVLVLDLISGDVPDENFGLDHPDYVMYKLPHTLFECGSSLTDLALCYCHLDLPTTINLQSLKVLSLYYIDLPTDAIERLTLGCPILEELNLEGSNRFDNLNITIKNKHVEILKIYDFLVDEQHCGSITLDAPNVLLLVFTYVLPRTQYHLNNLQSVTCADLSTITDLHIHDNNALAEVFHGLNHVKKLKLSSSCIQHLSLRKIQGLDPIFIQATEINLSIGFTKWELPGIAYLLQSAHRLENLTISIAEYIRLEIEDGFLGMNDFDGFLMAFFAAVVLAIDVSLTRLTSVRSLYFFCF